MKKKAALPGSGWLTSPPQSRDWFEERLGFIISDEGWTKVCAAYSTFGKTVGLESASDYSKGKNNPQSWHTRKSKVEATLSSALESTLANHGAFLDEASRSYSLNTDGKTNSGEARKLIDAASQAVFDAMLIVERAEPAEIEYSNAAARAELLRLLHIALGEPAIRSGHDIEQIEFPVEEDLSSFEQLVSELEVHVAESARGLNKWVARALSGHS